MGEKIEYTDNVKNCHDIKEESYEDIVILPYVSNIYKLFELDYKQ